MSQSSFTQNLDIKFTFKQTRGEGGREKLPEAYFQQPSLM